MAIEHTEPLVRAFTRFGATIRRVRPRALAAWVALACAALAFGAPGSAQYNPQFVVQPVPPDLEIRARAEAVILSDNDGGNPPGVITVPQLRAWIGMMNASLRNAGAHIVISFNPRTDLARVRNTTINRLSHDSNGPAAKLASHYPGKMVVLLRAYELTSSGGGVSVTGNGYTAYNPYVPVGSPDCKTGIEGACSASYSVLPSIYCATTVGTDLVKPGRKFGPLGPDTSGCGITNDNFYEYQNFEQFAHESGHYFGLPHTFPGTYDFLGTPALLQSWYRGTPRSGTTRSIHIYDGDSPNGPLVTDGTNLTSGWTFTIPDTRPDAGSHLITNNGLSLCNTEKKTITDSSGASIAFQRTRYTLHARSGGPVTLHFTPDKGNVMSYFLCKRPMTYSPGQVATMRSNIVNDPQRNYLLCDDPRDAVFKKYINCATGARRVFHVVFPPGQSPPPGGHDAYSHYY